MSRIRLPHTAAESRRSWAFGYPVALGLMLGLGIALYIVFKTKKWM